MSIIQFVFGTFVFFLLAYISLRLFSNYSILRDLHLPGPLIAKVTSKWLIFRYIQGEQMTTVHSLHLRYGPIVQTGPREISFSSERARRDIYDFHTLSLKSKLYDSFGPPSLFTFRDKDQHRERRARIAHAFTTNVLRELEPAMQEQISRFISILYQNEGTPWDIVQPTRMLALDIAGEVLLGQAFNVLGSDEVPYYVQVMNYVHPMFALSSQLPFVASILHHLPFKWSKDFAGSVAFVYGVYSLSRIFLQFEK